MPKLFGKNIPPVVMGLMGIVGVYAFYTVLFPDNAPPTVAKKFKAPIKKTTMETDYLLSDYTFKADPLPQDVSLKDAFKPLVVKSNGQQVNGTLSVDNYVYSGMAKLNDETEGLLENSQTGQGDFVTKGQKWHDTWLVVSIDANQIQLKNDSGDITTLIAGAASQKASASAPGPAAGNSPVNLVGPIGGPDLTIQPDGSQMGMQNNNNGRRRRGRNRGGGGGGNQPDGG